MEAAGILHLGEEEQEYNKGRKKRRTREEGIGGGEEFKPWGARKLLIFALVHKVPETGFNLDLIFTACKIHLLNFKITGDFAFLLPCFGLLKGCSSCNPCSLCDMPRSKEGVTTSWVKEGEVNLWTIGS